MSNPYEAPSTPNLADPAAAGPPRVSVGAYLMAVVSGLFVTFGSMAVVAFSPLFVGDWTATAPRPVLALVPVVAVGLGILSGWQSVRQARAKLVAQRAQTGADAGLT